ncbi:MAG: K(+)-transporting ATPase subunit C [Kofleriaceae bacterium]
MKDLMVALRTALVTLALTGILYPLVVYGAGQVLFSHKANGSIVADDHGQEIGSELIGQGFSSPGYLQPRPSASSYDAANSAGTNLAVTSKKLRDESVQFVDQYRATNEVGSDVELPPDAVTRSASGIDPDVSPENARLQAARIAKARGVEITRVTAVIDDHTDGRTLGLFGEVRVNVLAVNLALDRKFGRPARATVQR